MEQILEDTIALLERTPGALSALLRGLPEMWTDSNEGENTWSVREVMVHLIHADGENWMPRAKMIMSAGETQTFATLDRDGHLHCSKDKTLALLLDEFAQVRAKVLDERRALRLTAEDCLSRKLREKTAQCCFASQGNKE